MWASELEFVVQALSKVVKIAIMANDAQLRLSFQGFGFEGFCQTAVWPSAERDTQLIPSAGGRISRRAQNLSESSRLHFPATKYEIGESSGPCHDLEVLQLKSCAMLAVYDLAASNLKDIHLRL